MNMLRFLIYLQPHRNQYIYNDMSRVPHDTDLVTYMCAPFGQAV